MKKILFITLSFLLSFYTLAQESIDILTISGRYGFPQEYTDIPNEKATEIGSMIGLTVPIKFNEKTIWYTNITNFNWNISTDADFPSEIANPIKLSGFILRTGLIKRFGDGQGIQALIAPRFMSDLNSPEGNHFQFGGLLMYEKKYHDGLNMAFGLMYNQECFGSYFVPLVNLNWKLSDKWSLNGLLPIYLKASYKVSDKFVTGFSHFGLITTYRLGTPEYKNDYIERSSIDLSWFGRYKLAGKIFAEYRIGYSLAREYAQYTEDQKVDFAIPLVAFGDERTAKNFEFNNGPVVELRLVYNVPIPD